MFLQAELPDESFPAVLAAGVGLGLQPLRRGVTLLPMWHLLRGETGRGRVLGRALIPAGRNQRRSSEELHPHAECVRTKAPTCQRGFRLSASLLALSALPFVTMMKRIKP